MIFEKYLHEPYLATMSLLELCLYETRNIQDSDNHSGANWIEIGRLILQSIHF